MTPIQACKETKELWTEMARIAREEGRQVLKVRVPGPWQDYKSNCPCCEYVKDYECYSYPHFCPMLPEWEFYSILISAPCEGDKSPYEQWKRLRFMFPHEILCIDVEFFCLLIADMAEEAMERNIAESQPSLVEDKDVEYV